MDGRKIKRARENPIDNILIDLSVYLGKPLSKYSFFTPNVFTTMSLVISLVGIYLIYNEIYKIGAILVFIGYFFDCLDGNFARAYNMVTHFGDLYDHISDLVKYILLFIVILMAKLNEKTKIVFIILVIITQILNAIHIGCQEKFYDQESVLTNFTGMCHNRANIVWTRYVGTGTLQFLTCLFVFNIIIINIKICFTHLYSIKVKLLSRKNN